MPRPIDPAPRHPGRLCLLVVVALLLAASPVAATPAAEHRAPRPSPPPPPRLLLPAHHLLPPHDPRLVIVPEERPYTFLESRARAIARAMVLFDADLSSVAPVMRCQPLPPEPDRMNLVPQPATEDVVQLQRHLTQMLLAARPTSGALLAMAISVFSGLSFLTSEPPPLLRSIFHGPVHLGPATYEYGGLGLGVRAKLALLGG